MPLAIDRLETARRYIPNLHVISEELVRGGQPEPQGLQALKDAGVRTIVTFCGGGNLVSLFRRGGSSESPETVQERQIADKLGLQFVSIPLDVFSAPPASSIDSFIEIISSSAHAPLFIHCLHGRDRTGLMTGIYRVLRSNWTPEKAYAEMLECGFDAGRTNLSDVLFAIAKRRPRA